MDDEQVRARIEELEREEQRLRSDEQATAHTGATDHVAADAGRLEAIRVELDRLWDYLPQRRALRAAGQDPDAAQMRDARTGKVHGTPTLFIDGPIHRGGCAATDLLGALESDERD